MLVSKVTQKHKFGPRQRHVEIPVRSQLGFFFKQKANKVPSSSDQIVDVSRFQTATGKGHVLDIEMKENRVSKSGLVGLKPNTMYGEGREQRIGIYEYS